LSTNFERMRPFAAFIGRVVLGVIMFAHGWTKVIPHGSLYNFAHTVAHLGLPYWLGYVAAFTEFFGGIALILGLLTPVAALAVAIEMAVAVVKVDFKYGLTGPQGYEMALSLFALALLILAGGPGYLAVDRALFRGK
jgi:putative oxidoreductase